jgi:hypothetical protein
MNNAINTVLLHNVVMKNGDSKEDVKIVSPLEEVVYALATTNPIWTFELIKARGEPYVDEIKIKHEDEVMGTLTRGYSRRSGKYVARLNSNSISIESADNKKIIRACRKNLAPTPLSKLLEKEINSAKNMIRNQIYRKHSLQNDHRSAMSDAVQRFALVDNRELFMKYADSVTQRALTEYEKHDVEINALEDLSRIIGSRSVAYILLHKGKYAVRIVDTITTYDDTTIPQEYRAKLGMLKLIEDEQCITNIGCKISKTSFVIVL